MTRDDLLPPLARITPSDQRGLIWIIATICLAFIYLTFAARVFVRWRRFQYDDYAILAACVLVLAQASVSFAAVGMGLGVSQLTVDDHDIQTVWQLFIASEVLFILAIFMAKAAVLMTIKKILPPNMGLRIAFTWTLVVAGALCIASVLGVTINCGSRSLFAQGERRCSQWPRWTGVAIADAATDIWGFTLFCWVIWPLQMRISYKVTSTALLGLRLICVAFIGVHAYYVSVFEQSSDPAVDVIQPLVWQQLALTYSLLSAMAVALRPFFRDFHSGMGMDVGHLNDDKYGRGSTVHDSGAFQMNNLSAQTKPKDKAPAPAPAQDKDSENGLVDERYRGTNNDTYYEAAVYQGDRKPSSGTLSPHDFIRRDVEYVVTYDAV